MRRGRPQPSGTSSISRRGGLGLVTALVLTAAAPTRAATPTPEAPPPAAAKADTGDADSPQRLIRLGEVAFVQERFQDAILLYERAYEATQAHGLIFMMARCYEELGHVERAISLYQRFLATDPPVELRGKAETALRLLRQRLDRGTLVVQVSPFGADVYLDGRAVGQAPIGPLTVKPGRHEVRVEEPGRAPKRQVVKVPGGEQVTLAIALDARPAPAAPSRVWPWTTGGLGLALVAGGAVAFALGEADHREVDSGSGSLTQREAADLISRGDDRKVAGTALLVLGGGAMVVSGVLFALAAGDDAPAVSVAPREGGAVVVAGGSF